MMPAGQGEDSLNLCRLRIHLRLASGLNPHDLVRNALHLVPAGVDGEINGEPAAFAGLESGHATELAFDAPIVGKTGAGFESGHIAFLKSGGVFPECEIRKLS